jgi:ribonucleoside-diphosphate reductase alpha chain
MMAAVQPFISGAISKTVNMPEESTIEDINQAYIKAWELGVKAVAIYRDNSKRLQPLNTKDESKDAKKVSSVSDIKNELDSEVSKYDMYRSGPLRRRLPDTRNSKTHKFEVDGHEGYITVGLYEDGSPGEVFIMMSKQGSTLGGVMDSLAVLISINLQYGVPLSVLVRKFIHTKFEPAGMTINPKIPIASSIIDYIFRWLALEFLPSDERPDVLDYSDMGEDETEFSSSEPTTPNITPKQTILGDNKICSQCGAIAVRSGSCYACPECGTTSGCS